MAVQYGPLFRFVEAGQRSSGIASVAAPPRDRRSTNQEMDGTAGYWSVSDRHKSNPCGAAIIPDTRSIGRLFEKGRELLRYRGRFCRRGHSNLCRSRFCLFAAIQNSRILAPHFGQTMGRASGSRIELSLSWSMLISRYRGHDALLASGIYATMWQPAYTKWQKV